MEAIKGYFLALTAACVLCGIVMALFPGGGASAKLIRLISGILLTLTALRGLAGMELQGYFETWPDPAAAGDAWVAQGENMAREAMGDIIKAQTEAYILDKASTLGLEMRVEVMLSRGDMPMPEGVILQGQAAPFAKAALQQIIQEDLSIPKEAQIWKG